MGLSAWLNLKVSDVLAFAVANFLGVIAGRFVHDEAWSAYTMILVSYHLFLGWLVFNNERKTGLALSIVASLLTHIACVAFIVFLGFVRVRIPFFIYVRYVFAGMAVFERWWLFADARKEPEPDWSAGKSKKQSDLEEMLDKVSEGDHQAWMRYREKSGPLKPGSSVKDDYHRWMRKRAKARRARS